jgi:multiple sugar transport system ATP-binding protein
MARIQIDNITKKFGELVAVNNVSLDVADGEFVALLGPSGCGKTTTLRLIAGLEVPDAGRIQIGDKEVTRLPPRERDIAMVFQDYALYPHMTLLNNIGYPLKVRGVSKTDLTRRVTAVAEELQIGDLLERRPGQVSGGQQQRASVARALVHQAQVFLFDEPLSNLDAKLRLEARAFLKHLQQEVGVTAVYVTHDQAEAMALADRMAVMNFGRVMQLGHPLDVYRRPANTFVAAFIGNPPMNLLPCQVDVSAGRIVFEQERTLDISAHRERWGAVAQNGKNVTLGIRPENIAISPTETPGAIPGHVYVIQPLGGEWLVVVQVGDELLSVRLFQDDEPQLEKTVWLKFDLDRTFLYDSEGELLE